MSVIRLYREVWKQEEEDETLGQRRRDVVVSVLAPSAVLCAMADMFLMYWREDDTSLRAVVSVVLLGGVLSFLIFVRSCRILIVKEATLREI